jgi:hypothetical protein
MPKFYVHGLQAMRVKFEVEAESMAEVASKIDEILCGEVGREMDSELTGDWLPEYLIDPILEDGIVDYEKSQWFEGNL